ncbi:hypothetical protein Scep_004748 [Stephania cephalantha]|uniref:Uncharacterized protein n=1 Tax=Stephania cephalantha TaxID=152367 RepID=A0AAP0KVX5_9MAGN
MLIFIPSFSFCVCIDAYKAFFHPTQIFPMLLPMVQGKSKHLLSSKGDVGSRPILHGPVGG